MSERHSTGVSLLFAAATVLACGSPTDGGASRRSVQLRVAALESGAGAALTEPYVSVLDSLNLVVTSVATGARQVLGKHLERRDSTASFAISVEQGDVQFAVRVLSNNRTELFAGSSSAKIAAGNFAPITVNLTSSGAVLLVAPDSTGSFDNTTSPGPTTKLAVHNRGRDVLKWKIIAPAASSQCLRPCIGFVPDSGFVQAGKPDTLRVFKQPGAAFANPITFVVTSSMGDVPVVVRPF
jgi:hypothetical protein